MKAQDLLSSFHLGRPHQTDRKGNAQYDKLFFRFIQTDGDYGLGREDIDTARKTLGCEEKEYE